MEVEHVSWLNWEEAKVSISIQNSLATNFEDLSVMDSVH